MYSFRMKKVYTSENRFLVSNARNILEAQDISVTLRNEHASSAMGELSPLDTWMELWVVRERDYDRACAILEEALSESSAPPWSCSDCGESNDPSFELCWQCGCEAPPLAETDRTITVEL